MAFPQTIRLEHLPHGYDIHVALFRDVKNAPFLHQQLLAGNKDFEYAFIDASVILSRIHALSAAYRALNDLVSSRLKSRNVHSEIVFSLSPNNNIAESFRRFGITPATTNVLAIKVSTDTRTFTADQVQKHLSFSVEGEQVPFEDEVLSGMTDLARIRRVYKLSGSSGGKQDKRVNIVGKEEADRNELGIMVIGSMALRGATN